MTLGRYRFVAVSISTIAALCAPVGALAASFTVVPGKSIQAAVDAASPGDTIKVMPGDYTEPHAGSAAVRITKPLKLLGKSKPNAKVRLLPGAGQSHGILVEPANPGDPDVVGVKIKGFTVEGFPNNGIWLRHVDTFKIENNESINNLENGIWPTLSANGLVKKNLAYGSEDAALWVEASENVRVLNNEFHSSPTGLEITVSRNILAKKNDIHDNATGIGLYHPSAASLPPFGDDGGWSFIGNHIHDNNAPNTAPRGSMSGDLPSGGGILVLGVDNVNIQKNRIENNNFYGVTIVDYCLAVGGSSFDCKSNPPEVEPAPDDNRFVSNTFVNNGTAPTPFGGLELFAADVTYLMLEPGHTNCFAKNDYDTFEAPFLKPIVANNCE